MDELEDFESFKKGDVNLLESAIIAVGMIPCFEDGDEESKTRIVEGLKRLQRIAKLWGT